MIISITGLGLKNIHLINKYDCNVNIVNLFVI